MVGTALHDTGTTSNCTKGSPENGLFISALTHLNDGQILSKDIRNTMAVGDFRARRDLQRAPHSTLSCYRYDNRLSQMVMGGSGY